MNKRHIPSLAVIFLFVILAVAAIKAYSYYQEYMGFIEVCDHGIVYVPKGTKFVKCHGIVRTVIFFETSVTDDEDCACLNQKCCAGLCYVFIETDPETYDLGSKTKFGSVDYREGAIEKSIIKMWISC